MYVGRTFITSLKAANLKTHWSTCQWIEAAFQKLSCALQCSNRELLEMTDSIFTILDASNRRLAWFYLGLELILFDYFKYFRTELKNVQCQLVFVWGGRRLSPVTAEAGEKFTRKVYITRILMLITGINTAQICFLHKQIFLQFRDHISQSSIHRWYICLHRGTVQLFIALREKFKWNLLLESKC